MILPGARLVAVEMVGADVLRAFWGHGAFRKVVPAAGLGKGFLLDAEFANGASPCSHKPQTAGVCP